MVGQGLDRAAARGRLTIEYSDLMLSGAPAHTWALG
jgi:hypothetical protein